MGAPRTAVFGSAFLALGPGCWCGQLVPQEADCAVRFWVEAPVALVDPGGTPELTLAATREGEIDPWAQETFPLASHEAVWLLEDTDTGQRTVDFAGFQGDELADCAFGAVVSATLTVDGEEVAADDRFVTAQCSQFVLALGSWPLELHSLCPYYACE